MPPLRAMAMAIRASVTVSMLEEMIGFLRLMREVRRVVKLTSFRERIGLRRGVISTSA